MYKRPIPRQRVQVVRELVTKALPGGGTASYWVPTSSAQVVPSGHPSLVGAILDRMRSGDCMTAPPCRPWTPPIDYKFIASRMDNPSQFLTRCEAWFAANPPKVHTIPASRVNIDQAPLIEVYSKYEKVEGGPKMPPISELEKAWREAGYTEERIAKALAWNAKMEATADERQRVFDAIFAKCPSANKPTPKVKPKKVITVVKTKIPGTSNE